MSTSPQKDSASAEPPRTSSLDIEAIKSAVRENASHRQIDSGIGSLAKVICYLRPGLLSCEDWQNLIDGFSNQAALQDKSAAGKALQKLGYKHEKDWLNEQKKMGKKRGPQRDERANVTDREMKRLVANARKILNLEDETNLGVLNHIGSVIAEEREFKTSFWLISCEEKRLFSNLIRRGKLSDIPEERDLATALESIPLSRVETESYINDLLNGDSSSLQAWANDSTAEGDISDENDIPDEKSVYKRISEGLGLDVPFFNASQDRPIEEIATPKKKTPPLNLTRPQILSTANARLRELKRFLKLKLWCFEDNRVPEFISECRHWDTTGGLVAEFQTIFAKILSAQDITPLTNHSLESVHYQDPMED